MTLGVVTTLQQGLLFAGSLLLAGTLAWRFVVAPRAAAALGAMQGAPLRGVERRVAGAGLVAALFLVPVWVLRLTVQVMGFRDPFVPLSEDLNFLVRETSWGSIWILQGAVILLLTLAFLLAWIGTRRSEARPGGSGLTPFVGWLPAGALTLALLLTLAGSSHAMGLESGRALGVGADALHALAAGAWMGSLALILLLGRDSLPGGPLFGAQLRAFSPMAIACVTLLVAMGGGLSWVYLNAPTDLWSTGYGRVLSAKVGLAGTALLLGFLNWRRGLPTLGTPEGDRRVRLQAGWEVFLAVGVLLLTAILTQTPQP